MGDETLQTIGIIVALIAVVFYIREQLVKGKRDIHNSFRALKEVRPVDDIAAEEDAMRRVNGIMGQYQKKQKGGGGFFKGVIVTLIIVAVLFFIFGSV